HVALKVLPFHALMEPTILERFRREARAVAQLHHTNIVPVFGIDEHEGVHYYAMQFIQGQSLDEVIEEVKRLRQGQAPSAAKPVDPLSSGVAKALLSGHFPAGTPDTRESDPHREPEDGGLRIEDRDDISRPIHPRSSILDPHSSSVVSDGQSD